MARATSPTLGFGMCRKSDVDLRTRACLGTPWSNERQRFAYSGGNRAPQIGPRVASKSKKAWAWQIGIHSST